ncbi:CSC1-like protein At3g21620 [Linum perenne]
MATISDIGVSAGINILSAFVFLIIFAVLRVQPFNDRVYFPKWYLKGLRSSPTRSGPFVAKFVNLDFRSYVRFLNWMPAALRMPEPELIDHAGLDSAVYLRIYLLGLKIFAPIAGLAFAVLIPLNWTNNTLEKSNLEYSDLDKLSISNIPLGSPRFWAHLSVAYALTFWTCYVLKREYATVASMRLHFLASEQRRPDQFTVVYNANKFSSLVAKKKTLQNWLDYYQIKHSRNPIKKPTTKTGFLGICGARVDAIDHYTSEIEKLSAEQSRDPTQWLTEWAPEPRDVYWDNLAIPYVSLAIRRLVIGVVFFLLTFFFMIPIVFVQSLANIEGIEKAVPFLKPLIEMKTVKSVIQGFLPGLALKLFLIFLPGILMIMSKFEGFLSFSTLERRSATRYYIFQFINVFLGSIISGSAFQQLDKFMHQSATEIPITVGVSIPMKATFFITYIMVDGWAGVAGEILRLKPLIINVYNQEYESAAAFWPDVHGRIVTALVVSQLLLMGLMSTKEAAQSTPLLIALPVLTIWFNRFCKGRYEPAFVKYPLQEAMRKDTLERAKEPGLNLKSFLNSAYVHPAFKEGEEEAEGEEGLVVTKRGQSKRSSQRSGSSVPEDLELALL